MLSASDGADCGSGKCLVFPQHGPEVLDVLEVAAACVFSMPQWQTLPLQHAHAQWLEAADTDAEFQPSLLVNG
jgi:hypothetical protein